jgi:sec-independent protein translocase protein TatA
MTMPGGWELIVILFIILLLFGAKKLPGLAGSIGESIKEFRKSANEADEDNADETSSSSERDAES